MGGRVYHRGFQLTTDPVLVCMPLAWTWAWHIAGDYQTFSAEVGLGGGDTRPATVSFPAPDSDSDLPFRADGHWVEHAVLISGLPTVVSLNVAGMLNIVIEVTTGAATIDFGNDMLTPIARR